ncbi:hypothetical protein V2J09_013163 [Rumex salicifolius]
MATSSASSCWWRSTSQLEGAASRWLSTGGLRVHLRAGGFKTGLSTGGLRDEQFKKMSYRSKRTRNGDQANHSMTPSPVIESQQSTQPLPSLQREERRYSLAARKITKPVAKKSRGLTPNEGTNIRPAQGISISTSRNQSSSTRPHVEERPHPTKGKQYAFPPHLDPNYIRAMRKSRVSISTDTILERSQERAEVQDLDNQLLEMNEQANEQVDEQGNEQDDGQGNEQADEQENEQANSDVDPSQQRNEQLNAKNQSQLDLET